MKSVLLWPKILFTDSETSIGLFGIFLQITNYLNTFRYEKTDVEYLRENTNKRKLINRPSNKCLKLSTCLEFLDS